MTSIKTALESAALAVVLGEQQRMEITKTLSGREPVKLGRAWRYDPVQRKEYFDHLRAARKERWAKVQAEGSGSWKPKKWKRNPKKRSMKQAMASLLSPATM